MGKFMDLTGLKFGRWTVIEKAEKLNNQIAWLCECECGNKRIVRGQDLRTGKSKSCGCLKDEKTTKRNLKHGQARTRLYRIWKGLRNRCNNPNNPSYKDYGARGITVCKEWNESFEAFFEDMSSNYKDNLSIDRIDNNKGYYKENCRWATRKEQNLNTRQNKYIDTPLGRLALSQIEEITGIDRHKIKNLINKGKSEIIFETLKKVGELKE